MPVDVLTDRALNRATLARQLLLARAPAGVLHTVEHLIGMQAQIPHNPYIGLWSRLVDFDPNELSRLLLERQVVRIVAMRGTLHLLSADDYDSAALAYACRNHLALVQVPPRGVWGRSAHIALTTAEAWLGRTLCTTPSIEDVVLRYFRAFGPASVADVATWVRLTAMHEVVERLRPRLRTFRDERGRELFDVPDAPRPGADTPAPPRFLPEYDNVVLSHADRSRFVSEGDRKRLVSANIVRGSVLFDGRVAGTWSIERDVARDAHALVVTHLPRVTKRAQASIAAEGRRLLRFYEPGAASYDVRFVSVER